MRISDWSSDVCSSDLHVKGITKAADAAVAAAGRASDRLTEQMKTLADATAAIDAQITDARAEREIGRASCRERVCQYVSISVVAVSLKTKNSTPQRIRESNRQETTIKILRTLT